VSIDAALGGLSEETLAALVAQERAENAAERQQRRDRDARMRERAEDLRAQYALGLRSARSPAEILAGYAGDLDNDQNAQRCRATFERWLQAGGQADELKQLLGDKAARARAQFGGQQETLRRRAAEAEARRTADERRIAELEREVAYLRGQVDRSFEAIAETWG
jgi:hypothetical protein